MRAGFHFLDLQPPNTFEVRRPVSVIAEAARVVPMTGLPMSEMTAELVPVPMVIAMHGEVMPIVMVIVMPMHIVMAEMIEAVSEKSMAVKSMAEAVRAAAFG